MSKLWQIHVNRFKEKADNLIEQGCTISKCELRHNDEVKMEFYCCEPAGPDTTTPNQDKRIPAGTYQMDWETSTMSGHKIKGKLPLLYNDLVPKSRRIRIHIGNYGKDSLGCLLPGITDAGWGVGRSKDALTKLLDFIFEEEVEVIITNNIERSE